MIKQPKNRDAEALFSRAHASAWALCFSIDAQTTGERQVKNVKMCYNAQNAL